jgi:hypothetical protein
MHYNVSLLATANSHLNFGLVDWKMSPSQSIYLLACYLLCHRQIVTLRVYKCVVVFVVVAAAAVVVVLIVAVVLVLVVVVMWWVGGGSGGVVVVIVLVVMVIVW